MPASLLDAPQTFHDDARPGVAPKASPMLVLEPARSHHDAAPILLDQPQSLIGSGAECSIRLPENGINSHHALLLRDGPHVVIRALDRRTWLNGYPVTESLLREGDLVAIGPVEFRVRRAQAEEIIGILPVEPRGPSLELEDSRGDAEFTLLDSGRSLLDAGRSQLEAVRSLLESERMQVEAERARLEADRAHFETERQQFESRRSQLDADRAAFETVRSTFETERAAIESARTQLNAELALFAARQAELEVDEIETERRQLAAQRSQVGDEPAEFETGPRSQPETARIESETARAVIEAECRQLETAAVQLEADRAALESRRIEFELRQAAERTELASQHSELDATRAQLESECEQLEIRRSQSSVDRDALDARHSSVEAARAEIEAFRNQLELERSQLDQARTELESVSAQLAATRIHLDTEVARLDEERTRFEAERAQTVMEQPSLAGEPSQTESGLPEFDARSVQAEIENSPFAGNSSPLEAELGPEPHGWDVTALAPTERSPQIYDDDADRFSRFFRRASDRARLDVRPESTPNLESSPEQPVADEHAEVADSVAAYMEKLLQRSRHQRAARGIIDEPAVESSDAIVGDLEVAGEATHQSLSVTPPPTSDPRPLQITVDVDPSRRRAVEQIRAGVGSMREIANLSARAAVATHTTRKLRKSLAITLPLSVVAFLVAAAIYSGRFYFLALGPAMLGAVAAIELVRSWLKIRHAGFNASPTTASAELQLPTDCQGGVDDVLSCSDELPTDVRQNSEAEAVDAPVASSS
jgi:hypothetical protein